MPGMLTALATNGLEDLGRWARGPGLETVLTGLGAVLVARLARHLALRSPMHFRREGKHAQALAQALAWLATATIWVIAAVVILGKFNLPLSSVVPPATVAGVAVGFGAQKIVADLLSGFFLFAERQLGLGDVVRISQPGTTSGVTGTVEELTLRTTRLRTNTGEVVFIPNGEIRQLTNLSMEWARLVIDVPLGLDADLERAIDVLNEAGLAMAGDPRWADILLDPPAVTGVEALDVSSLRVRMTGRTTASAQFDAGRELRRRLVTALHGAGIVAAPPVLATPPAPEGS